MTHFLAIAIALSALLGSVAEARAEWFAGLYLGLAATSDTEVTFTRRVPRTWQMTDAVALFAEHRFVHLSPRYEFSRGPVDLSINGHHLNVGVSYTFGR